jgi:hypothetical protein
MTHEEAYARLRGRVQELLTAVDQASREKRPLEVYPNSRHYDDLREALFLARCSQEFRDAFATTEAAPALQFEGDWAETD